MRNAKVGLLVLSLIGCVLGGGVAMGAVKKEAFTTIDPLIAKDQLEAILRPLEIEDLILEAEAWQDLVKAKVGEIAFAEVAVKRHNEEIAQAEAIAQQAEETKNTAIDMERSKVDLNDPTDVESSEAASQKAKEIKEATLELEKAVVAAETPEGASSTGMIEEAVLQATATAQEKTKEAVDTAVKELVKGEVSVEDSSKLAEVAKKIDKAVSADEKLKEASEVAQSLVGAGQKGDVDVSKLAVVKDAAEQAVAGKEITKLQLIKSLNEMRIERNGLLDRFQIVLAELDLKGGKSEEYRNYITAVSGITIDWWDPKLTWLSLVAWGKSDDGGMRWVRNVMRFVLIIAGFWVLSRLMSTFVKHLLRISQLYSQNMSILFQVFLVKLIRHAVFALGFVFALSALELDLGPILAVIGAAGFVVAFALQDSLSNFASGIMILFFRPFDVNDVVEVAGISGKVHSVSLVSTVIKTFDNKKIIVPNNSVWGNVITNANASNTRRVDMVFRIGYADDMAKAQAILEEVTSSHEKVLAQPETVVCVNELGDSSVNFICRPWTKSDDYWSVYWEVTRRVKEQFDAAKITIPVPQRDVHVVNAGAEVNSEIRQDDQLSV